MKKNKFSLSEKKSFRIVIVLALLQLAIVFAFVHLLTACQQIHENDTKQIDITVDDAYYIRVPREDWLIVVSDSTKYLFKGRSTLEEYSTSELYKHISDSTKLSLRYKETRSVLGRINLVVDARSEAETYRSIEEFNRGRQGVPALITIIFSIIELVFVGIALIYVCLNYTTFKSAYKKTRNHLMKKERDRETVLLSPNEDENRA